MKYLIYLSGSSFASTNRLQALVSAIANSCRIGRHMRSHFGSKIFYDPAS